MEIYLFFSYYGEDHRSLPEEEEMEALDVLAASYRFKFKSAVHSGAVPSVNGTSHEKWLYTPM